MGSEGETEVTLGEHRRVEYVIQRSIARWLGAAGALIAFAVMLLAGCMWAWTRGLGQASAETTWLLGGVAVSALTGGICAMIARMWAR